MVQKISRNGNNRKLKGNRYPKTSMIEEIPDYHIMHLRSAK